MEHEISQQVSGDVASRSDKDVRKRMNWHLTSSESGMAWSVGLSEEGPGYYSSEHPSVCDYIIAPGEYVESHPEVRRSGLVDHAIRQAINDWYQGKDVDELEERYHRGLLESVYGITQEDLERYKQLDAAGDVIHSLFDIVMSGIDLQSNEPYDVINKWDVLRSTVHDKTELSETQRASLLGLFEFIRQDTMELERLFHAGFTLAIARRTGAVCGADSEDVKRLHFPGALGFVIDERVYKQLYPKKRAVGFCIRVFHDRDFVGKMFDVNGNSDVERTIRHEYAHVLYGNYFRPYENRMGGVERVGYRCSDIQELFYQMRDELIVYSAGGEYPPCEDALIRGEGMRLQDHLEYVTEKGEVERFVRDWNQVRYEIEACKQRGIPADSLFAIYLSSGSFDEKRKRLFLAQEDLVRTKR